MTNARMLFAAARGARIQTLYLKGGDWWMLAEYIGIRGLDGKQQRIHPADEHMQYGPVSLQLRRAAENPPELFYDIEEPARTHAWESWLDITAIRYARVDDLHKSIFLLLLAELLADSGL